MNIKIEKNGEKLDKNNKSIKKIIPNLITSSRLVISGIVCGILSTKGPSLELGGLLAFGMFTDTIDGYSARKLKAESELGKVLDPIIDFISFHIILWALGIYSDDIFNKLTFFSFSVLNLFRDITLFNEAVELKKKGKIFDVSMLGKIKTRFNMGGISVLTAIGDTILGENIGIGLLTVGVSLSVASLIDYKKR